MAVLSPHRRRQATIARAAYLDRHRVLESRNLDELRARVAAEIAPHDFRLPARGRDVEARLCAAPLDELSLFHVSYGSVPIDVVVEDEPAEAVLFCLLTSGRARFVEGRTSWDLSPDCALMRDMRRSSVSHQVDFGSFALPVPLARLRAQAEALWGPAAARGDADFGTTVDLHTPAGRQLRSTLYFVAGQLDGADGCGPLIAAKWEDLLLTLLLSAQPSAWSAAADGTRRTVVLPYHVKRARDFIHEHAGDRVTLAELAQVAGCSYRTLQAAFAESVGLSPMAYLKAVRLEAVHAELATAGTGESVAAVARRWGFEHPGRFAADYRRRYGRSPRETLLRRD